MMNRLFAIAIILVTVAGAQVAQQAGPASAPNQVIVKFRSAGLLAADSDAMLANDVAASRPIGGGGANLLTSRSLPTSTLVANLRARPDVVYAEPNYVIRTLAVTPSSYQWGLLNGSPGISAVAAWGYSTGSQGVVVGVLDTGAQLDHPDLAANMWTSSTTISVPNTAISCPAGSHGMTSWTDTSGALHTDCNPTYSWQGATTPFSAHGTHVSGIIGAAGISSGVGPIVGVNQSVGIMELRVTGNPYVAEAYNCPGGFCGYVSDAVNAIEFAIQAKAAGVNVRVLSNSWGWNADSANGIPYGCPSPEACVSSLAQAISDANAADMLFVAAAGNGTNDDGIPINNDTVTNPIIPASLGVPNIISVAATGLVSSGCAATGNNCGSDEIANFSNYGQNTVHLGAPGVGILSTIPYSIFCGSGPTTGYDGYCEYNGTSMATPHVAGAAALVLAACANNGVNLTTAGLKGALLSSVDQNPGNCQPSDALCLYGHTSTGGRLNVYSAIVNGCENAGNLSVSRNIQQQYGNPVYWARGNLTVGSGSSQQQTIATSGVGSLTFQAGGRIVLSPYLNVSATGTGSITFSVGPQVH